MTGSKPKNGQKHGENVEYVKSEVFTVGELKFQTWKFVTLYDIDADEELLIDYCDEYRKTWMCRHKLSLQMPLYEKWICNELSHHPIF
jgi:hypothetical protein